MQVFFLWEHVLGAGWGENIKYLISFARIKLMISFKIIINKISI